MIDKCEWCQISVLLYPKEDCHEREHWEPYAKSLLDKIDLLQDKLDMKDDDRDKYEIIDAIAKYPRVRQYNCHECGRDYNIPVHLVYFTCVCGHHTKLRRFGAEPLEEELLDVAMAFFGNERMAQLAWIAEIVGGKQGDHYSGDEIRKMIRQELNRWEQETCGWKRWKLKDIK